MTESDQDDPIVRHTNKDKQASRYARSLLEASLDPLVTISPYGKITDVNEATVRITGVLREELIGTDFLDYFTQPDQAKASYQKVFADGFVQNYPLEIKHRDGRMTPVMYNASVYKDESGQIIGVFAAARDVTEQKQAEAKLTSSEMRYRRLFETAKDGILILNADTGMIEDVNPFLIEMLGYSHTEFLGKQLWEISLFKDIAANKAAFLKLQEQSYVRYENLPLRTKDGRSIWVEFVSNVYAVVGERIVQCNIRDITERKVAELEREGVEEELRKYREHLEDMVTERTVQLEAANKDLEGFAYSVSHDLRVPLRAIDGFSHQVLKLYADKLDDEGKRYLNIVRDNTKRMGQLIDDILAFSRMGRLEMSKAEVDIEKLVSEVLEELKPTFAGRELTIEIKQPPPCHGDRAMLRQVWVNLLGNAIKFSLPKAAAARVEVGGYTEGAEQVYYIRDNGVGFDMQYADKLFGVFQRLHGIAEFEGTGIGLAIVKRIITRHGGRVWADGKVNEGATFYFALPN